MAERLTRPLLFFGIKHCGKSTLGRLTAEHFGVKFVDTDLELESRFQMLNGCPLPTRDIFRELGEEGFRRLEAETVEALAAQQAGPRVVALGGGVPANPFVEPEVLKKMGFGVYLAIRPEIAFERVRRRGLPPFLASFADPYAEFLRMNRQREAAYRSYADLTFPIEREEAASAVAEKLIQIILTELKP